MLCPPHTSALKVKQGLTRPSSSAVLGFRYVTLIHLFWYHLILSYRRRSLSLSSWGNNEIKRHTLKGTGTTLSMRGWTGLCKAWRWLRHREFLTPLLLQRPSRASQHQQWVSLHCSQVAVMKEKINIRKCQTWSDCLAIVIKEPIFLYKMGLIVICGVHSLKLRSLLHNL